MKKSAAMKISPEFSVPLEFVTETCAILAKRGAGKTHTGVVFAEELLRNQLQVVAVDPVGVWWGLRSSKDGKSAGFSVYIFGGEHADVPLEATAGKLIADTLIDTGVSAVLDLSLFRKNEQTRFMVDFAERFYQRNRKPVHMILDEADAFAPQRPIKGQERMLGAVEDLMRRGRARGIGITLITQRAAVLNKNVLTQAEVLVTLRMPSPQDRKAADEWIRAHGSEDERKVYMDSLASLPIGTAWFWSPGWLNVFKRVKVRDRKTFDSSATPKVGKQKVAPKAASDINLDAIRKHIEGLVERAKDEREGPKKLREENRRLARDNERLKREVKKLSEKQTPAKTNPAAVEEAYRRGAEEATQRIMDAITKEVSKKRGRARPVVPLARTPKTPGRTNNVEIDEGVGIRLRKGAVKILAELAARSPATYTKAQVATLTRFSPKGGTFNTYMGDLKRCGFIADEGGVICATEAGIEFLGDRIPEKPKTHDEVMALWRTALRAGAHRMLECVVAAGEDGVDKDQLANWVEMQPSGGTFNTYLGDLKRNGLIVKNGDRFMATEILFPESAS